jgi:integrase
MPSLPLAQGSSSLPDDFAVLPEDIPDEPEEDTAGKDLPTEVMRVLTSHLDRLETSSGRDVRLAVEMMMDTGRRPDEIASLMLDCLEADPDGDPVLIYDNHKEHRKGRRLPIATATATIITAQQDRVRARFADVVQRRHELSCGGIRRPAGPESRSSSWPRHMRG